MDIDGVMEWMNKVADEDETYETAVGFCMQDILEFGFDEWLDMPASDVSHCFIRVTTDVSETLLSELRTALSQERMLDELGIEQSYRINQGELVERLNDGLMDIMRSQAKYFEIQERAKDMYTCK